MPERRHLSFRWQKEGLCCSLCNPVALADFETAGVRIQLPTRDVMHPDGYFELRDREPSICVGCLQGLLWSAGVYGPAKLKSIVHRPLEPEVSRILGQLEKARTDTHLLRLRPTGNRADILCGFPGETAIASFEPADVTCLDCLRARIRRPL